MSSTKPLSGPYVLGMPNNAQCNIPIIRSGPEGIETIARVEYMPRMSRNKAVTKRRAQEEETARLLAAAWELHAELVKLRAKITMGISAQDGLTSGPGPDPILQFTKVEIADIDAALAKASG